MSHTKAPKRIKIGWNVLQRLPDDEWTSAVIRESCKQYKTLNEALGVAKVLKRAHAQGGNFDIELRVVPLVEDGEE